MSEKTIRLHEIATNEGKALQYLRQLKEEEYEDIIKKIEFMGARLHARTVVIWDCPHAEVMRTEGGYSVKAKGLNVVYTSPTLFTTALLIYRLVLADL